MVVMVCTLGVVIVVVYTGAGAGLVTTTTSWVLTGSGAIVTICVKQLHRANGIAIKSNDLAFIMWKF